MSCFLQVERSKGKLSFACGFDVGVGMVSALMMLLRLM